MTTVVAFAFLLFCVIPLLRISVFPVEAGNGVICGKLKCRPIFFPIAYRRNLICFVVGGVGCCSVVVVGTYSKNKSTITLIRYKSNNQPGFNNHTNTKQQTQHNWLCLEEFSCKVDFVVPQQSFVGKQNIANAEVL